ncbi:MAG TPA: ABC transporter permease [Bacteroidia bacterium]|nr:ABC transporter permease [Bacteroidia bacterium]
MRAVLIIARKELQSFFDSLIAYVMLVAFLGFTGLFTWLLGNDIFFIKQATLSVFFYWASWAILVFTPAITMKMLAEESKSGTIELLLTKPITNWQVLWGKFLACFTLIFFALLCTLPYYITVINLGKVDNGVILCGYLGLLLMSAAYVSIGIFASSISNNQIISFIIALVIGVFFQFVFTEIGGIFTGSMGQVISYLGFLSHYDSISRGVVDSRDIIYFGSIVFIGLVLAEVSLAKRGVSE